MKRRTNTKRSFFHSTLPTEMPRGYTCSAVLRRTLCATHVCGCFCTCHFFLRFYALLTRLFNIFDTICHLWYDIISWILYMIYCANSVSTTIVFSTVFVVSLSKFGHLKCIPYEFIKVNINLYISIVLRLR